MKKEENNSSSPTNLTFVYIENYWSDGNPQIGQSKLSKVDKSEEFGKENKVWSIIGLVGLIVNLEYITKNWNILEPILFVVESIFQLLKKLKS